MAIDVTMDIWFDYRMDNLVCSVHVTHDSLTQAVRQFALDKADRLAAENAERMSHEEVFGNLRRKINAQ